MYLPLTHCAFVSLRERAGGPRALFLLLLDSIIQPVIGLDYALGYGPFSSSFVASSELGCLGCASAAASEASAVKVISSGTG